jgi:hypothetical protein
MSRIHFVCFIDATIVSLDRLPSSDIHFELATIQGMHDAKTSLISYSLDRTHMFWTYILNPRSPRLSIDVSIT